MRRVVVTGLGVLSPLGRDLRSVWDAVAAARSGITALARFTWNEPRVYPVGEVHDFDPTAHFAQVELELLDRFSQFAVVAAREAAADAGLELRDDEMVRAGVAVGSAYGGAETYEATYRRLYGERNLRVHPVTIPRLMHNAAASQISKTFQARGPCLSISTACASAAHAVGEAFRTIRDGAADVMLAGGSDAPLTPGILKSWEAMRVLASGSDDLAQACRPFSADRDGIVLAEGAAVLVLEDLERARRRGAHIYAELAGYGATSDAGHITQPSVDGPARAIELALQEAGAAPDEVDYINAHGTATRLNDVIETRAIHQVFRAAARVPAVSSTKSMHGHLMGASGALELLITILGLHHGVVPPTAHYRGRDPECDLDYVPNEARRQPIRLALSNSFAFGGLNAVLAVRQL